MRKLFKPYLLIFIIFLLITLAGCNDNDRGNNYGEENNNSDYVAEDVNYSTPNRKIIYNVEANIYTDNLTKTINTIKNDLNQDEWIDEEIVYEHSANLTLRIKTERLNDFLDEIFDNYEISNFKKIATDVSLKYQNKATLILTYEKELERLQELYDEVSFSEVLQITKRISELEVEIQNLKGELNEFDSLVEYSEIKLTIILGDETEEDISFWQKIGNAFTNGLSSLITFLANLLLVITTIIPWCVVFAPIGYIIYRINKHKKSKKQ